MGAQRVVELSAQIHAAMAELVALAARMDSDATWFEDGVLSCAHWLTINTGVDVRTGSELVRVGHALEQLPRIRAAFAEGRLSFDKVRAVTRVATPETDALWLEMGTNASGAQLTRLCRAVRRALETNEVAGGEREMARRELNFWWRDDGMLRLVALLPREDGAAVLAAIEAVGIDIVEEQRRLVDAPKLERPTPHEVRADTFDEPATRRSPVRWHRPQVRADALVRIAEECVAGAVREPVVAPTRQMVVHVDSRVLTESDPAARCHIEDGPWLTIGAARWLSCDADVVAILERDGSAIDVGRVHRVIPPRLRLAMQARDQGCRYPACGVPPRRAEGHHVRHWDKGGRTDLSNIVSLCRFHHRRHHEGAFEIRTVANGDFRFEARDGTPLIPVSPCAAGAPLPALRGSPPPTPRAGEGGRPCSFAYAVSVIADACASP